VYLNPLEAFSRIDYKAMDQTLNNFDVDTLLFKEMDDSDDNKVLKSLLGPVFNMPIAALGPRLI
jgi:hypothetical protein